MLESEELKQEDKVSVVIAYHADCIDGFTAAWVAVKAMEAADKSYCLAPMHYDEVSYKLLINVIDAQAPKELFVLDFSLELATLESLRENYSGTEVVILDHHKTAFERYAPELDLAQTTLWTGRVEWAAIHLNLELSGAGMAWRYFFSELEAPKLIMYVEDYDLWRFTYGAIDETKYINKCIKSYARTLESWDVLHRLLDSEVGLKQTLSEGEYLQNEHEYEVKVQANNAVLMDVAGYKVPTVDCPYELVSDVGHTLAENSAEGFAAMLTVEPEKCRIKWGLRSVGDFDVSLIAKLFGGGGHKNAAGFYTPLLVERSQPEECISSSALPFEVCLDESN